MNGKKAKQLKKVSRARGLSYKKLKDAYRVGAIGIKPVAGDKGR